MPGGVNPKLAEFSLNFALQEDERFDEVGPAGQVLWCLRRLEPDGVREVPLRLQYSPIDHDRSSLSDQMLGLEAQLDDEHSPIQPKESEKTPASITISLIHPHLREGTLPLSARTRSFFPTAYESPRVRFTLVDGKSGLKMPAWVVRSGGYIYGLRDWYKSQGLMPGSLVEIRRGTKPGEVIVQARTQRSTKDWIRTLMVGADGGMVFAMLKQPINAEFNDRMAIYVPDLGLLDPLWGKHRSFEELVVSMMRELTKLTPQGHVHAQELYAAVNLVRRVPPAPLLALLAQKPFMHVGDLHFRMEEGADGRSQTFQPGQTDDPDALPHRFPLVEAERTRLAYLPAHAAVPRASGHLLAGGRGADDRLDRRRHRRGEAGGRHRARADEPLRAAARFRQRADRAGGGGVPPVPGQRQRADERRRTWPRRLRRPAETILRTLAGPRVYRGLRPVQ